MSRPDNNPGYNCTEDAWAKIATPLPPVLEGWMSPELPSTYRYRNQPPRKNDPQADNSSRRSDRHIDGDPQVM